jgi:hypothetical protein
MPDSTPVAAPAPAPDYQDPQGRQTHFESALAAALKEAPPQGDDEMPTPVLGTKGISADPKVEAELVAAVDSDKQPPPDADLATGEKPAPAAPKADEATAAGTLGKARRLFDEGDVDGALALALGTTVDKIDGAKLQSKHFKALVNRERAAQMAVREAETKAEEQVTQVRQAAQSLLPMIKAAQAYEAGDLEAFVKHATGDSLEAFQMKVLEKFKAGALPAQQPRQDPVLLARLNALENERAVERAQAAKLAEENKRLQSEHAAKRWNDEVAAELAAVPQFSAIAKKPSFVKRVQEVQRSNYNPKTQMTLDAVDAAQIVWDELYAGVIDTPTGTVAPAVKGAVTGRGGLDGASGLEKTTNLNYSVATEAAPDPTVSWSPEHQKKILEAAMRKAKSEAFANGV